MLSQMRPNEASLVSILDVGGSPSSLKREAGGSRHCMADSHRKVEGSRHYYKVAWQTLEGGGGNWDVLNQGQ